MTRKGISIEFKLRAANQDQLDKFFDDMAAAGRLMPPPQLQVRRSDGSVVDLPPGTIVVDGILTRSKVERARDRRTTTELRRAERRRLRFARRARASKTYARVRAAYRADLLAWESADGLEAMRKGIVRRIQTKPGEFHSDPALGCSFAGIDRGVADFSVVSLWRQSAGSPLEAVQTAIMASRPGVIVLHTRIPADAPDPFLAAMDQLLAGARVQTATGEDLDHVAEVSGVDPRHYCPECGAAVATIFDHVDLDCSSDEPGPVTR